MRPLKIKPYKKKDGKTYYKFQTYLGSDEVGNPVRAGRQGFATEEEARKEALKLKKMFADGEYNKPNVIKFSELYEKWLDENYRHTVAESTLVKTKEVFDNHILNKFGDLNVDRISPRYCQEVVSKWSKHLSHAKTMKGYVKRVLSYAVVIGLIESNPMDHVFVPIKKTVYKERDFFDKSELLEILEGARRQRDKKWYLVVHLMAFAGLKTSEILAIEWEDIIFDRPAIKINKTLTRGENGHMISQDKRGAYIERIIPIDNKTIELIKEFKSATVNDSNILISSSSGGHTNLSHVVGTLSDIAKKINYPKITSRSLRYSHIYMMKKSGVSKDVAMKRLGVKSYDTITRLYEDMTKEQEKTERDSFTIYLNEQNDIFSIES